MRHLESAFAMPFADLVLATIGITASFPATGYGYIQKAILVVIIQAKPYTKLNASSKARPRHRASYLNAGDYFWNAGIFIWSVSAITAELEKSTHSLASPASHRSRSRSGARHRRAPRATLPKTRKNLR